MTLGSFVHGALSELTEQDLERMLELDETLFVEHKSDLREETAFKVARAVGAFANTLGGWLLLGDRDRKAYGSAEAWANDAAPTLVDALRDRLRLEIDPLPAFEARVMRLPAGPVGVVRIYESSDTPHVMISNGSVFVREVAGDVDTSGPRAPEGGTAGRRRYIAAQIRSRQHLLDLAARGEVARRRVDTLLDPARPLPLISQGLSSDGREIPRASGNAPGRVTVQCAPYTLPSRFVGWATTLDGASAVFNACESLAGRRGFNGDWLTPHPSGSWLHLPTDPGATHRDEVGEKLGALAQVVVDAAGVAAAGLQLESPETRRRTWTTLEQIMEQMVRPTIAAAGAVLAAGEILGRARCQIELGNLRQVLLIEGAGNGEPFPSVPVTTDVMLPLGDEELDRVARLAVNALARSAGMRVWD